ncbi:hypothetical protein PCASD_17974 [Puccinia coronata f. sp. avenae]|uniref:Uncharacterized protein n=1 Tax=Puccinia coronata f. sp. avenae TaxID=200324 RepID=A0A2N5STP1_9BASI|nr:hypothetical protein PCASD_17974 [Puccinia coronata f. sp. avenae]
MLEKTKTYLQEALKCDAIILATALNPAYWLSMIQAWFPRRSNYVKTLLQDKFNDQELELEVAASPNQTHRRARGRINFTLLMQPSASCGERSTN